MIVRPRPKDWLLAALTLPPLPWQCCCTLIDKVDKEMLPHAAAGLNLKSPGAGTSSSRREHTLSPLTISGSLRSCTQVKAQEIMPFSVDLFVFLLVFTNSVAQTEVFMAD